MEKCGYCKRFFLHEENSCGSCPLNTNEENGNYRNFGCTFQQTFKMANPQYGKPEKRIKFHRQLLKEINEDMSLKEIRNLVRVIDEKIFEEEKHAIK